jgi:hypothetical protein
MYEIEETLRGQDAVKGCDKNGALKATTKISKVTTKISNITTKIVGACVRQPQLKGQ